MTARLATKWKERAKEDRANREQIKKNQKKILEDMTREELNEKMEKILEENNLDWQSVHLWIINKGYVIITEEEYDNLEVIDPDGLCP